MAEPDPSIPGDQPAASEPRNLPVPVPRQSEGTPTQAESFLARMMRTLFGWKAASIRQGLEEVLEAGSETHTGFSPTESVMLRNILGLRERRIEDVMIPRADIVAVQQDINLGELLKVFENAAHSRLVVYEETLDDAVGMVHIRDLIALMTARAAAGAKANTKRKKPFPAGLDLRAVDLATPLSSTKITRPMLFVPPSMPALDVLAKMQASHTHLALVIDEYGGADGLVSIEDVVEQIVGDIADEHDDDVTPDVVAQPDGSFLADARAKLDDVLSIVGPEFDVGEAAEEVDTLGGYLFARIGRVPVRGELVPGPGPFEIEVLDADPRRVKRLKILRATDRQSTRGRRMVIDASPLASANELPVTRDAAVKLSPDAPKAARRP